MDARQANAIKSRTPLSASRALRSALAKRGKSVGTITYFYSAKNDRDIVVSSDLEFAHVLLLEATESVKAYDTDADRVIAFIEREGYLGSKPDAIVALWSGRTRFVEVKYLADKNRERALLQAEVQKRAAEAVGAEWSWFSEDEVHANERLLHDWLHIAPVLSQSRIEVKARWKYLADWVLEATREKTTLDKLRIRAEDPWELVFSATFRLVQAARLCTDLDSRPLSPNTVLMRRTSQHA